MNVKLIEMLALDIKPHPHDVVKGNFRYWTDLSLMLGIDLNEEAEINNAFQEEANE